MRFLIVEYKGEHLKNEDTKEKELIGKVWAEKSGNLFLMAWKKDQKGRDLINLSFLYETLYLFKTI